MKKILMVALCMILVPMLFAAESDALESKTHIIRVCPTSVPGKAITPELPTGRQEDTISYDNYTNVTGIGMNSTGAQWAAAIRLTTDELLAYTGYDLIAVVIYRYSPYTTTGDTLTIYGPGTPSAPGAILHSQTWTPVTGTWNRIDLTSPVPIDGVSDIWISDLHTENPGGFPSGAGPGPYVPGKGDWVWDASGGWYELGPLGLDYNWNIWAIVEPGGPTGITWDFEDGWQDWTHTNGLLFPEAWGVQASGIHTPCPNPGDSSMWMDSDASGGGYSDSALSPLLIPNPTMDWLKYGYYNYGGGGSYINELRVGIRHFTGGVWNVVELAYYPAGSTSGPGWDSFDVSAYVTADLIQIYFYHDDLGTWGYYSAFDNVSIDAVVYVPGHDVASIEFLSPGLFIAPGTGDVIGVVANLGNNDETYDVHCVVTDPSVVLDATLNVTTLVGEMDTLNFGSVDFQDGTTYDIMMATLLVGDTDPTNDTLTQSTYCTSIYWEILTNMPYTTSGPYAGYSLDASNNLYIHVFGGNPGPQSDHYIWDGATWNTGTALPQAATYGGHCSIDNKIYMIGARTSGPDALITIYDADGDVYSTVTLPHAIGDPAVAAKDNNYIYIIGGCLTSGWTASTSVMLYDVAGDSFITTVTQLPVGTDARTCAVAGYIGNDTIIVAGGIDGDGNYTNTTLLGYVDPANPGNVTWSHGSDKPGSAVYRLNGEAWNGTFYIAGGDPFTNEAYAYESGTGWFTLPDKPTAVSNWGCAMAPVDVTDDAEGIMYALGGYSPYMSIAEALHTGNIDCIYEQPDDIPITFTSRMISSNPVVDRAQIEFAMPHQGSVTFSIYNISGRRVHNSEYSSISAGMHTIVWPCTNDVGRDVPSGIYFYRLKAAGNFATGKLVIVQ